MLMELTEDIVKKRRDLAKWYKYRAAEIDEYLAENTERSRCTDLLIKDREYAVEWLANFDSDTGGWKD